MTKVVCIGELLIDMVCCDIDQGLVKGENFIKKAGGAPANVAATVSKLGGQSTFIGKVGQDAFGEFLIQTLSCVGVDTQGIIQDPVNTTTMAFVALEQGGERDFQFNRGADGLLTRDEINIDIHQPDLYHFGSATALLPGQTHDTYLTLINELYEAGQFISMDPNYRHALWSEEAFKAQMYTCLPKANLLKVSEEELLILGQSTSQTKALKVLHQRGVPFILVTMGAKGCLISSHEKSTVIPSVTITSIDSTGAGDAFIGAVLWWLAKQGGAPTCDFDTLIHAVQRANTVGAMVCEKLGAIAALPSLSDLEQRMGTQ